MMVTISICTWNRAQLLKQTLNSMCSLNIPNGTNWEVLVVNNNSTDETETVINEFLDKLPIRKLFEPVPGKSNALNHAVREAKGDLFLWTDDDVIVSSDWMTGYVDAFKRWPKSGFFGGPTIPLFEGNPPKWLQQIYPKVEVAFAVRNLGETPCSIPKEKLPFGANLSIPADVQRRYVYDRKLGPRPNSGLRGEETAVLEQMIRDGLEGIWVPNAAVKHFIPKGRQSIEHLRSFYSGYGTLNEMNLHKDYCVRWFGKPRWAIRAVIQNEILFLIKRLFFNPEIWIDDLIRASIARGVLKTTSSDSVKI